MHDLLKGVRQVGFDLDQTLYPLNPEINDRVRTEICRRLVEIKPAFETIENARKYFEREYAQLNSGRKVLKKAGLDDHQAGKIMDESLATADVLDLISPDRVLRNLLGRLSDRYDLFLITGSPEEIAEKKLRKIGIDPSIFAHKMFSDTRYVGSKSSGLPFLHMIQRTREEPGRHVYFGDSKSSDILPAKIARMLAVGVWSEIQEADISIPHIHNMEALLL